MNLQNVKAIADAVLYEGYILYPYRASAIKNRQRFNFGTLYPADNRSKEPTEMRTECIVVGDSPMVDVWVRFLHLINREVLELEVPASELPEDGQLQARVVASLNVDGKTYQTWQEAVERDSRTSSLNVTNLLTRTSNDEFLFDASVLIEPIVRADGKCVGVLRRSQSRVEGTVKIRSERIGENTFKLIANVANHSRSLHDPLKHCDGHLNQALTSTHAILGVTSGEFVSLVDPPESFIDAAAACQNVGVWPVLAGSEETRDRMLASPIILYDYPEIAPESGGDFFDGTSVNSIYRLREVWRLVGTDHPRPRVGGICDGDGY